MNRRRSRSDGAGKAPRRRPWGHFGRRDDAVIDLPLKLLLTAVILALTVPAGFFALESYSESDAFKTVKAELHRLEATARHMIRASPGSAADVDLDFTGSFLAGVDFVHVGHDLNESWAYGGRMAFQIQGRAEESWVADPFIAFTDEFGEGAVFSQQTYKVRLHHVREPLMINGEEEVKDFIRIEYIEV